MAPRRSSSSSPAAAILTGVVFIGLIGTALYVAMVAHRKNLADEAQASGPGAEAQEGGGYEPFADYELVDPYADREGHGGGPFATVETPDDLLQAEVWKKALALGQRGYELAARAARAERSGDKTRYRQLGRDAQRAFDEAFTSTADWETELVTKYGESASEVREVMRTRNKWIDRVRYFHKATPGE